MKDELGGRIMTEFATLRPKMIMMKIKKAKRTKKMSHQTKI